MKNRKLALLLAGLVVGGLAILLTFTGNPQNMGFCIACFIRDTAGALGFHQAAAVQYLRPELLGLVIGSFLAALVSKEFSAKGGSAPFTRFILGAMVMIAALVFLGCPLRMVLRMAGGDLNALIGLVGFVAGICVGIFFLNRGFSLQRSYKQPALEGLAMPVFQPILLAVLLAAPALLIFSESGPGSMRAPIAIALGAGVIVGILAQRTRLCMVGGWRDMILLKDPTLLMGFLGIFVAALIGNLIQGKFTLGTIGQPIAHNDFLWNFLSMMAVGLGSVLLGGCPLRQMILAGEGNSDSALTVMGMLVGGAIAHNYKLASSATQITDGVLSGGPTVGGKIATVIILVVFLLVAALNTRKAKEVK